MKKIILCVLFLVLPAVLVWAIPPIPPGSSFDPASPGAIGGTTPAVGMFTDLTATGNSTLGNGSGLQQLYLDATPATDHTGAGLVTSLTCGETLNIGDAFFVKSDGKAWLAKADATTTMPATGLMLANCTVDQTGKKVLIRGIARDDTWNWTVGGLIYITITGTTGNTLSQTAPSASTNQVQIIGLAIHADYMIVNPNYMLVQVP